MAACSTLTFQHLILDYYDHYGRHDLPWRLPDADGFDPYKVMVSELMLQQTQVSRVIPKFEQFVTVFPTVADLAAVQLGDVLKLWSGLGYNRRAQYLHRAAQIIVTDFSSVMPSTIEALRTLPGVGVNTAAAIAAYSYNQPVIFVETNIRSVYIHHFFAGANNVTDAEILAKVAATLDVTNPRCWYWALMDYGTYLKNTTGNAARRSASYSRQSVFAGSRRQMRGQVIKLLGQKPQSLTQLRTVLADERLTEVLQSLVAEGLINQEADNYHL
ncbi:A/G-specific adenine glycosylase [Polaromonas sp.]|nr:A/G-specific adenine glycosylase [Candidatus Saccharibacteria bacterium]